MAPLCAAMDAGGRCFVRAMREMSPVVLRTTLGRATKLLLEMSSRCSVLTLPVPPGIARARSGERV